MRNFDICDDCIMGAGTGHAADWFPNKGNKFRCPPKFSKGESLSGVFPPPWCPKKFEHGVSEAAGISESGSGG